MPAFIDGVRERIGGDAKGRCSLSHDFPIDWSVEQVVTFYPAICNSAHAQA
ncbi:hypothetical protein [Paraburkholderia phosphatilytica]|uniref:hypothetical protein n=1 Tax=Paraburkholderia phosphatilytica TaxID=2282883 RepID=UPI0013E07467|nr:hypothetical protein [Paraburkholderia phosphatilytica]